MHLQVDARQVLELQTTMQTTMLSASSSEVQLQLEPRKRQLHRRVQLQHAASLAASLQLPV